MLTTDGQKTGLYPGRRFRSRGHWRVKGPHNATSCCYHVMSRTCGGAIRFDEVEREALQTLIFKMSDFLGVKLLTWCLMPNHFHLLAEVPNQALWLRRFEGLDGEKVLLRHLASFYSPVFMHDLHTLLAEHRRLGQEELAQRLLSGFKRRFCDLSIWGKEIKERFGRWYNKRHERKGTLWMERFKSVLVEHGEALRTMAAYIDLNPVRAALVDDPKDYRWCGYAAALAGQYRARAGLCQVMVRNAGAKEANVDADVAAPAGEAMISNAGNAVPKPPPKARLEKSMTNPQLAQNVPSTVITPSFSSSSEGSFNSDVQNIENFWSQPVAHGTGSVAELYRQWLYGEGRERYSRAGVLVKPGVSDETSREVTHVKHGRLTTDELLRQRVRHFSEGLALGSREWVETVYESHRESFGAKRQSGARRLRQAQAPLFALRDLAVSTAREPSIEGSGDKE